jgi:isoleucyl-tRNA synthetase
MQVAQDITSMVLALRRKVSIKGTPAAAVYDDTYCRRRTTCSHIEAVKDLIMSEVNVKEIKVHR